MLLLSMLARASILLFLPLVLSSEQSKEPPKELVIDVVELPKSCVQKAATGDKISVHYVSGQDNPMRTVVDCLDVADGNIVLQRRQVRLLVR